MAKDSLWHTEALGGFISSMGAFPVHRGAADRGALEAAEAVLRAGQPLVLFPEGTRKEGATIGELHEGASFLAARTGAPIVPVGIAGTDRAMPRGAKVPRPRKVHLVIGPQVPAPVGAAGGARVPRRRDRRDHRGAARGPPGRLRRGVRPAQRSRTHVRSTTLR